MLLLLKTDYMDYYDAWFDYPYTKQEHVVFERIAGDGVQNIGHSKQEQFRLLKGHFGEIPVPNGPMSTMAYAFYDQKLVVYDQEYAHAGNGKRLIDAKDYQRADLDKWCSLYVKPAGEKTVGYKYLRVGLNTFILRIYSLDSWRSNVDTTEVEILNHFSDSKEWPESHNSYAPILSIDYVVDENERWRAVDLNIAPGCRGTGINKLLPAKEAVESIKDWYARYKPELFS